MLLMDLFIVFAGVLIAMLIGEPATFIIGMFLIAVGAFTFTVNFHRYRLSKKRFRRQTV